MLKKRGPYTPQIVINGEQDIVGNRDREVKDSVSKTLKSNSLLPISIDRDGKNLTVVTPQAKNTQNSTIYLFSYKEYHVQDIPNGENAGRTVAYTNPVTDLRTLGAWDGKENILNFDVPIEASGYAVIIQDDQTGKILAAGKV